MLRTDSVYTASNVAVDFDPNIIYNARMNKLEFPIKATEYLHGEKFTETVEFAELVDEGYDEDFLSDKFRYLIYELKMELELHENGKVFITKIGPREIIPPILAT